MAIELSGSLCLCGEPFASLHARRVSVGEFLPFPKSGMRSIARIFLIRQESCVISGDD
jgi:hypothetical protein